MKFRTEIPAGKMAHRKLGHEKSVMLIGSCFSDHIGNCLDKYKFKVLSNPLGITFNPVSIDHQLQRIIENRVYEPSEFFHHQGLFKHFELHSSFCRPDLDEAVDMANSRLKEAHKLLPQLGHLFITLGTSWVYENKNSIRIVSNCHKVATTEFNKRLLSTEEICALGSTIEQLKGIKNDLEVIFTISPIRHLKDGFEENSLSKALLRVGIDQMVNTLDLQYFPSFEMVMDDLRDYRYFERDLVHPNELAIEYIWNKLSEMFFDEKTKEMINGLDKINQGLAHRAFQPSSSEHQSFLQNQIDTIESFSEKYPDIDLSKETEMLKSGLSPE